MPKPRTLIATVAGMISEEHLGPLSEVSEVSYRELKPVSQNELADMCDGYDFLMLNYDVVKKLDEEFYRHVNVQRLQTVSTDITGMDWANYAIANKFGVKLQHVPYYSTESVAETILCEVLLHSRRRLGSFKDQIHGRDVQGRMGINLRSREAGVVGIGNIGARVVELLSGVGMAVSIWSRSPKTGYREKSLEELFSESDVICLCMKTVTSGPGTNTGIIGEALLQRCSGAIVVNLAGALLVDNDAMARALSEGRVSGYTVERSEALLASPLASADTVHLPPSDAWKSDESLRNLRDTWISNTVSAIRGFPENVYVE